MQNTATPSASATHGKGVSSKMPPLSDDELIKFNDVGLIPGPGESLEAFSGRATYCITLKEHLSQELQELLSGNGEQGSNVLQKPLDAVQSHYGIRPSWIPVFFSNYKLMPWNGGCAWIFQQSETSPTAALIQLRRQFKESSQWLGIYSRDELLTHELVHVGRMEFHEPKFEEMLAYRTSKSRFRRLFGPIIQSSMECILFILLLFIIVVFDVFLVALGRADAYAYALWIKLIPVALIGVALIRLWNKHRTLNRCLNNLQEWLQNKPLAEAILYRLTDAEIHLFSRSTPTQIQSYANDPSPRWQVIRRMKEQG